MLEIIQSRKDTMLEIIQSRIMLEIIQSRKNTMLEIIQSRKIFQYVGYKAKGRISKRVFQESKDGFLMFSGRSNGVRVRGKKCLFFGNFGVLCFLETPVLRFTLLPYYRRIFSTLVFFNISCDF